MGECFLLADSRDPSRSRFTRQETTGDLPFPLFRTFSSLSIILCCSLTLSSPRLFPHSLSSLPCFLPCLPAFLYFFCRTLCYFILGVVLFVLHVLLCALLSKQYFCSDNYNLPDNFNDVRDR